jgi:hypothetical protein
MAQQVRQLVVVEVVSTTQMPQLLVPLVVQGVVALVALT